MYTYAGDCLLSSMFTVNCLHFVLLYLCILVCCAVATGLDTCFVNLLPCMNGIMQLCCNDRVLYVVCCYHESPTIQSYWHYFHNKKL